MTDPLILIAGGSEAAARIATDAIRARDLGSPMAQARAARAARIALSDPQATFSGEERRAIAALLDTQSEVFQIRLKPAQKQRLEELARASGVDMATYLRRAAGLE